MEPNRKNRKETKEKELYQREKPILQYENDQKEVGDRIRKCREKLGITQEELADRMEKHQVVVSRHESGKNEMKISVLFQYADALHANLLELCPERFSGKS